MVLWRRFPHVTWSDLVPKWTPWNMLLLTGAAVLFLFSTYLNGARWNHMLHVLGIHVDRSRVLRHTFAGQFVSRFPFQVHLTFTCDLAYAAQPVIPTSSPSCA